MARPTVSRQIDRQTVVGSTLSTAVPSAVISQNGYPSGDQGLALLNFRVDGQIGLTGGSAPVKITNGPEIILRSLTVETDKHGKLVDAMEGLLLHRILQYEYGTESDRSDVSSTPVDGDTFYSNWPIPFALPHAFKPFDTLLDVWNARPKVTSVYGAYTDIFTYTGGTPGDKNVTQSVEGQVLPGPLNVGVGPDGTPNLGYSELPLMKRSLEMAIWPINATQTRYQIPLPFGDRIWRRIYITQRNGSSRAELSTVIASTANVTLSVNNTAVIDTRTFQDIRSLNKSEYQLETLPAGVAVLDFDADFQNKINDMLSTLSAQAGTMYLYIDVTSVSNGQLWLGFDSLKPLPDAAKRG